MKAWLVRKKDEVFATVVFAETRGQARSLALSTEACEYSKFTDIEAYRMPQIDTYFKSGKREMDWDNPNDRIVLVKECGFICDDEYFEWEDCDECSAKEYCDKYSSMVIKYKHDFAREILPINLKLAELL